MITDQEKSSLRIKLDEIYDLADKHLGQSKQDMIINDVEDAGYNFSFVSQKIKALKTIIISGQKFDTPLVYRILNLQTKSTQVKPKGCSSCDDGYIMAVVNDREICYACSCELGKFRRKTEKLLSYGGEEKSDNFKLMYGLIKCDASIEEIKKLVKLDFIKDVD